MDVGNVFYFTILIHCSTKTPQVYLSTRRGAWVVGRVGEGGAPGDVVSGARLAVLMHRLMPTWSTRAVEKQLNKRFEHHLYGLQPSHGYEGGKADFTLFLTFLLFTTSHLVYISIAIQTSR